MAQSKPHTPGTARGAKLAALLVDEGTALVRKIFEDEVKKMNPPSLREQLKGHERYLCGLRHLNPGQRKTLYPRGGDVPSTAHGFDISLLELLLKELVRKELHRKAPYADQRNSLREYRNDNYGHISSTELSEEQFDTLWKKLTDILVALGGDRDRISERLNSSIDPEQERKYFELLERQHKEDIQVKDLLLAQGESLRKGQEEVLDQGKSLLKGQEAILAQGERQRRVQEEVVKGQEAILAQGESQRKVQEEVVKGQEAILAQGESQKKEILDQGQNLEKELTEIKSLLEENRDAQSPGANFGQHEDSSSSTGLSDVADDVIACLQDLYRTESAHVRPLPWCEDLNLHLGEVFTNLQLQRRDGRGSFQVTGTILSLADIYEGEGIQVNVRSAVKKVRVEGDPGIGKSCSCQKLAYDWSCGKLGRFKVVFFLEMRHLAGKVKDEIFEQLLPKDTNTTPDQLWSYIQQNQDDVLFILDGLDELRQAARQVTDVVDLIQGKILRNCHVLVTSRPYHCVKDLEKCHQFYRIVGFSKKNSEEFIRKYFCEFPESGSKLVEQLQPDQLLRDSYLSEIVVNPLNNLLICVVWEDNNNQLPSSKAELYEMIVLSVAKRFCTKKDLSVEGDELPPDIEAALRGLGKLSWEGLEQEELQFNIAEVTKKYGTNADNMLSMGLLTRDYSFSRIKRTCLCAFLHKTFQEYMAAHYISGLFTGGSREEEMKCLRSLLGLTTTTGIDSKLILDSCRKYMQVQDWLLLILGENANPLFDMFAEELNKVQTDEDKELLSFVCLTWLGRTECAGDKMAEIVAPCLSQHATNNLGDFSKDYNRHISWIVGLTHVLTCQKKLVASNNPSLTQHLTVNLRHISARSLIEEELGAFEKTLSDYDALRSVTLLDAGGGIRAGIHTFSPLRTFIPRCGAGSVSIDINPSCALYLSLLSSLEQLSVGPKVGGINITLGTTGTPGSALGIGGILDNTPDMDFSEYDRLLAQMIVRQNCLRSLRLEIGGWYRQDTDVRGFGNLTETLQSISRHATLEEVEFELPVNDVLTVGANTRFEVVGIVNNMEVVKYRRYERFDVGPMVHELTECIKKNKLLKTLRLRWKPRDIRNVTHKVYHGVCSSRSLSRLCSAIQRNRTLETLEIEGMLTLYMSDSQSGRQTRIIANLLGNKPSNYKVLNITIYAHTPVNDFVTFPAAWVGYSSNGTAAEPRWPST
ncbi:hypothetical protein Bbelb_307890 [Branchiostoma belcheri]|nr:hypothetical protein Bbelb_307890 [Branchiostoma belcheri]